jgi:hypothetical protein
MKQFIGKIIGKAIFWFFLFCCIISVGSCTVKCVAEAFK